MSSTLTKLQLAIAAAIDSYDRDTCAAIAERAAEQLGYEPSLPSVSRQLSAWGWRKITIGGKTAFARPLLDQDKARFHFAIGGSAETLAAIEQIERERRASE